jgi:flagellum-specific peptidoglycan hydrolase FlgJ
MRDCFADRDRLILKSAAYAEARACASDPQAFMKELARHWATDPRYAEKLGRIYRENALNELDVAGAVR